MVQQERSDQGSLSPPMEQIRNMQSIATTIFVNGIVDGVPMVDLASAVGLAERVSHDDKGGPGTSRTARLRRPEERLG